MFPKLKIVALKFNLCSLAIKSTSSKESRLATALNKVCTLHKGMCVFRYYKFIYLSEMYIILFGLATIYTSNNKFDLCSIRWLKQ